MNTHRSSFRSGFSFTEVMFAVVILGIGFIMVAAIFPVALEQTRSNADESKASQVARDVMKTIASVTNRDDYQVETGTVRPFSGVPQGSQLYNKIASSLLDGADPRYAAIPYYSAVQGAEGTFQVTVVVVQCANRSTFTSTDLDGSSGSLLSKNVTIDSVQSAGNGVTAVAIAKDPAGLYNAVGTGAFLVIEQGTTAVLGKPLRIGQKIAESDTEVIWALAADTQIATEDQFTDSTPAGVIGRDYANRSNATDGFAGAVQDVAAYTTFIKPN